MTKSSQTPTVHGFFSRHGTLSRWHPNFEYRAGQLAMAEEIETALAAKRHLIVEAGTGTGKTLAYLVPAILSGKRIVISTGTKNLQEQLFFKDVPFLQQHFPQPLSVCYMKGRSNYACRQRIYDAQKEPVLTGLEEITDFHLIQEWEKTTETGDRVQIRSLAENSSVWAKIDARRELCTGQRCPQFDRCFITLMRQRAAASDIIIVNHHLFFADLAVREAEYGGIIPDYAAVVFDEAHEIEDVAGQHFGFSISNYQFEDLRRDISALLRRKELASQEIERVLDRLEECAESFFALFESPEGRSGFQDQDHARFLEQHGSEYQDLIQILHLTWTHLELIKEAPDEVIPLHARCQELADNLKSWVEGGRRSYVYWVERRGRGRFLQGTPIDISPVLEEKLFGTVDTVVLTSATLAVAGGFDFLERRLGLRHARTLIVPGHFDYASQVLLYVPQHLPEPNHPSFSTLAAREVLALLRHSRGRAFVLFTSYQQMQAIHERVSFSLEYPTLLQGTAPRSVLLEQFRATPNCVLFATSSFWQGVDVPGEQLSCVIIDKLPFAVPRDPVVAARIRSIQDEGGNAFFDYQVPQAAIALKQGFGRLIRSRSDRGVLVLLDNRISKKRYGQTFFDSLPDYRFTTELAEVEKFFDV
jgi:ATP-dependent DNA helicase DinG